MNTETTNTHASRTPWTPDELKGRFSDFVVSRPKIKDIDGGRETIWTATDADGRTMVAYFWVAPNQQFQMKAGSAAVCRNFRRGKFGDVKFRNVSTNILEREAV